VIRGVIRAVINTNVVVSGLLSPNGTAALVLLAIRHGLLRPCFSQEILAEYAGVLGRPKFGFPSEDITALMAMLRAAGDLIAPQASVMVSPDPGDTKFVTCAVAGDAAFIVTGNSRHFPDGCYGAARVVTPAALLDRITMEL
jgi:putative PIN family toxin of toxin-antitoxin system